jgi:hypothetical protein
MRCSNEHSGLHLIRGPATSAAPYAQHAKREVPRLEPAYQLLAEHYERTAGSGMAPNKQRPAVGQAGRLTDPPSMHNAFSRTRCPINAPDTLAFRRTWAPMAQRGSPVATPSSVPHSEIVCKVEFARQRRFSGSTGAVG